MITERLLGLARAALAHAHAHDREGFGRRQNGAMPGPGVVGMAMGDDGTVDRAHWIDEEAARLAEQALGQNAKPAFRMRRDHMTP
jgi:hypothetical protein